MTRSMVPASTPLYLLVLTALTIYCPTFTPQLFSLSRVSLCSKRSVSRHTLAKKTSAFLRFGLQKHASSIPRRYGHADVGYIFLSAAIFRAANWPLNSVRSCACRAAEQ